MKDCEELRPLIQRAAEGEAAPHESILIGLHLSGCTACRIRQSRERVLQGWLENDLADLPVDEQLVNRVMAKLPVGPPPARKKRNRRGLMLALLALAVLTAVSLTANGWGLELGLESARHLTELKAPIPNQTFQPSPRTLPWVAALAQQVAALAPTSSIQFSSLFGFGLVAALLTAFIAWLTVGSAVIGVAARACWQRTHASTRAAT